MRYAPLLPPALLLIALLLAAGCQDVSFGSTKMGDFGNSPEEKAVLNDLIQKYGNPMDKGDPRFLEPLVTTKLSEKLVPEDKVTVFSKDVPSVWFWAVYDNFEKGDALTLTWTYVDKGKDLAKVEKTAGGDFGRAYGEFVRPDNGWPLGNHRITISGRGITASADFRIQEGATQTVALPWPAGIEVNVTTLPAGQPAYSPVSCFTLGMNQTMAPALVSFSASCSEGNITQWAYDFGDGTPPQVFVGDAGRFTQHTYFTEGAYRITLYVVDAAKSEDMSFLKMALGGPVSESGECNGPGPGYVVCMGKCANLETDPNNCGWCNTRCHGTACVAGTCEGPPSAPNVVFTATAEGPDIIITYYGGPDAPQVRRAAVMVDTSGIMMYNEAWPSPVVGSTLILKGANTSGTDHVQVRVRRYDDPNWSFLVLDTSL